MITAASPGTVYLIHFDRRYKHAGHYLGWTPDLAARLAKHQAGQGARLLEVVRDAGITWQLARTWEGGRDLERLLKRRHASPRLCPLCAGRPAEVVVILPAVAVLPGPPGAGLHVRAGELAAAVALPTPAERGAAKARAWLAEHAAAGQAPARIAEIHAHMWRDYDPERARPAARQFYEGYHETARQGLAVLAAGEPPADMAGVA